MTDEEIANKIKKHIPLGETRKVSEIARKLRIKRAEIEEIGRANCYGIDLIVAIGSMGGHADLKTSEYELEHYE